jgi:hypothetical protein
MTRKQPALKLTEAQAVQVVKDLGIPTWVKEWGLCAWWLFCIIQGAKFAFATVTLLMELAWNGAISYYYALIELMEAKNISHAPLMVELAFWVLVAAACIYTFERWRNANEVHM